jgi:ATP-dependent Lhr-like helicase
MRADRWRSLASAAARGPLPIQRMQSDDLLATVFPDAAACQENIEGDITLPIIR